MDIPEEQTEELNQLVHKHYNNIVKARRTKLFKLKIILAFLIVSILVLIILSLPNFYLYDYLTIPKLLFCIAVLIFGFEELIPRISLSSKGIVSVEKNNTEDYLKDLMNNPEVNACELNEELREIYNDNEYMNKEVNNSIDELTNYKESLKQTIEL